MTTFVGRRGRGSVALLGVLAGVGSLVSPAVPSAASALPATCLGRPATTTEPVGTEGDDVMVVAISPYVVVEGLAGDDTICLVSGGSTGGRDPQRFADAGAGDDVVTNTSGVFVTVTLGAGSDHYVGADTPSTVYTGAAAPPSQPVFYFGQSDTEPDVVETRTPFDRVYTGDTTGLVPNPDQVTTAAGTQDVFFAGVQAPGGLLQNGGGAGDRVFQVGDWPPGHLQIDVTAGTATVGDARVLAWSAVSGLIFATYRPRRLTYRGSAGDDSLSMVDDELADRGPAMTVDVRGGRGSDDVTVPGRVEGRLALGAGTDTLFLPPGCRRLTAGAGSLLCEWRSGSTRLDYHGVEEWFVHARTARVRGTRRDDQITVQARRGVVLGRAGDDDLSFSGRGGVVDGGPGRDRCFARQKRRCERG